MNVGSNPTPTTKMITKLPDRAMSDEERREAWAKARRATCDLHELVKMGDNIGFSKILKTFGQLEEEIDKLNWDNAARIVYNNDLIRNLSE